jgi:hypothetical protein
MTAPEQRYCMIAVGRRSPTKQYWKKGVGKHISVAIAMMPTIMLGQHDAHRANQLLGHPVQSASVCRPQRRRPR